MSPRKKKKKSRQKVEDAGPESGVSGPEAAVRAEGDVSEPPELEEHEATAAPTPEQVIEALSEELEALEDRHLRLVAEFDNFRKRSIKERAQNTQRAQADLAKQLLESLDDLARVSELGSTDHDAAAILEGVQLVERKLLRVLEQLGLKRVEAVGQPFNPEVHEAMVTVATEHPEEDELISQELAKGYTFGETLLRPALVEVKMYKPPEEGGGGETGESEDGS